MSQAAVEPIPQPREAQAECVQVVVRCRPLSSTERQNGNQLIVDVDRTRGQVVVRDPAATGSGPDSLKSFTFDCAFPPDTAQERLYDETARAIVDSVLEGYNGTVFAYGQTGTGKTFTMEGVEAGSGGANEAALRGVIPRAFEQVFANIALAASRQRQYLVRASFLEIYQDELADLLAASGGQRGAERLELKENSDGGVYVRGLQTMVVRSVDELQQLLARGKAQRKTGATLMNADSSRSHCVFTITVECGVTAETGEQHIRVGKLNMVDLAGSERQVKTGAEGQRLKEATKINLSLSALGNVISALTKTRKASHIPYRDSKLTRLLQDSLGGNTRTVMIANVGPADYNFEETISTLRFAHRAKSIQNKPRINEDPKDTMLREMQEEIARLKQELEGGGAPSAGGVGGVRGPGRKVIVDKVVEKVVTTGVSEERLRAVEAEAEAKRRAIVEQTQQQREAILAETSAMDRRGQEILREIQNAHSHIEQKRENKEQLSHKLVEIEASLLKGQQLLDRAGQQEITLAQRKVELQKQKLEAERVSRVLRQREEANVSLATQYESADKELDSKNKKLERLRAQFQEMKKEIEDVQAANQREREDMLETVRQLTRAIQLKDAITKHFVPSEEVAKVQQRAAWNDDTNEWILQPINFRALLQRVHRPRSVYSANSSAAMVSLHATANAQSQGQKDPDDDEIGDDDADDDIDGMERTSTRHSVKDTTPSLSRPQSDFARFAAANGERNPRYHVRNIVTLELDMPERTTRDYVGAENNEPEPSPVDSSSYYHTSSPHQQQQLSRPTTSSAMHPQHVDYRRTAPRPAGYAQSSDAYGGYVAEQSNIGQHSMSSVYARATSARPTR